MEDTGPLRISGIFGLDGAPLNLTDLPPSPAIRWVMRRKAEVLTAVCSGLLNVDEACKRYGISMEEFLAWKSAMERFGPPGLQALRLRRQNSVSRRLRKEREEKQCVPSNDGGA